ncbi:MAG: phosphoribosylformylglycinamidine synthase I [Chloroflexi bacterium]|nr:phosphoribosylformylglycinamidine synthase I [Chloroflexota bacterium]|tara:strand:- start:6379 stop:7062 length:684 start_codon:yes stop_codon:yes gene_type:complete
MNIGIIVFPGTWSDRDCEFALSSFKNVKTSFIWHKESIPKNIDAVILPGGFSHGDHLRAGAIAQFSVVMKDVFQLNEKGKPIIGICNGFQILCEAGILPGALIRNKDLKFNCSFVNLKFNDSKKFTSLIPNNKILKIPISHGEGNYQADLSTLNMLQENDQIAFQYCSESGMISDDVNPNGSLNNIAGIYNKNGNVLGMMPHPERSCSPDLGSEDGNLIFKSMIKSF